MERRSEDSRLRSMRGKILTRISVLAVANAAAGCVIFFAGMMFVETAWMPAVAAFVAITGITIALVPWIAGQVLGPLDKLLLLAKSIERTPGMSVPATTGAVETDDLLHTISRASRQLTNFLDLMDEVVAGNTDAASQPFEHSDRLSESFQKLVAKVTDSIGAKADLDRLQTAVDQISADVSGLDRGDPVRIRTDFAGTREITDALRSLTEQRSELTQVVASNASDLKTLIAEAKNRVSAAMEKESALARTLRKALTEASEINSGTHRIMYERAVGLEPFTAFLAELKAGPLMYDESSKPHASIRRQFETAINKLRNVGEQSLAITHVAKAVQDLAKRSNMIALNTSIHANAEDPACMETLTQEITSLSERAEKANKAIAGISDSVVRDVNEANASMQWVSSEVAKLLARADRSDETIGRLIDALNLVESVEKNVDAEIAGSANQVEASIKLLEDCLNRCIEISNELQTCESSFEMLREPLEAIRNLNSTRRNDPLSLSPPGAERVGRVEADYVAERTMSEELLSIAGE